MRLVSFDAGSTNCQVRALGEWERRRLPDCTSQPASMVPTFGRNRAETPRVGDRPQGYKDGCGCTSEMTTGQQIGWWSRDPQAVSAPLLSPVVGRSRSSWSRQPPDSRQMRAAGVLGLRYY